MKNKGITLIEALLSIAILAIIFFVSLAQLSSFKEMQGLRNTSDDVISLLNEARSNTISGEVGDYFSVFFEPHRAVLYKGSSLDPDDSYTTEVLFDSSVTLEPINIVLNSSPDTVSFDKLSGDTNNYGTITLELLSDPTKIKTITIFKTGLISLD